MPRERSVYLKRVLADTVEEPAQLENTSGYQRGKQVFEGLHDCVRLLSSPGWCPHASLLCGPRTRASLAIRYSFLLCPNRCESSTLCYGSTISINRLLSIPAYWE